MTEICLFHVFHMFSAKLFWHFVCFIRPVLFCIFFLLGDRNCTAAPLTSTPDVLLFPLNNSVDVFFFSFSISLPPVAAVFHCQGMLTMTHLRLLCISLHPSLIHANVGVSSSRHPTWACSPGVILLLQVGLCDNMVIFFFSPHKKVDFCCCF